MNLLIHSMGEYASLILPIMNLTKPKNIVEIGSEHGGLTTIINSWAIDNEAHLTSIDPAPSEIFRSWADDARNFCHIEKPSLAAIPELSENDCWFVDGDHNWYTVYHELVAIHNNCTKYEKPLLVFLHDIFWPCGRRDSYYNPGRIPEEFLHPHTYSGAVTLDSDGLVNSGFRGEGSFAWAEREGGPQNGVLTAIEDFAALHEDEFALATVPAVFGLGVLFSQSAPWSAELAQMLLPYHSNPLLAKLEENRLRNYLRVIELQDELNRLNHMRSGAGG